MSTTDHKTRTIADKSDVDNVPSLNHMHRCSRKIFSSPNRESLERIYLFTILLGTQLYLRIYNWPTTYFRICCCNVTSSRIINILNLNTKNVVRRFSVMHRLCYC